MIADELARAPLTAPRFRQAGTGFPVTLGDGKVAALTVWDGSKEAKAASIRSMPYGARTVAELVAKPRFVVAHRGGSASWPEHQLIAVAQ